MGTDEQCGILCTKSHSKKELEKFRMLIDEEYRVQWQLDGLPVTMRIEDEEYIERGFPLGYVENVEGGENTHYLYNHVRIIVKFSENEEEFDGKRIVGFEVVPMSVNHQVVPGADGAQNGTPSLSTCKKDDPYVIEKQDPQVLEGKEVEVLYTYDVVWEESEIAWANRYDIYLKTNPDDEIHYFSIVNSLMILLFLTGVVAMIMLRTLHKDISSYNELQTLEEAQEESGWKLVHGDVFRPPTTSPLLLSVMAGSGVQITVMMVATMVCALFGLTSPANRGGLLTTLIFLFVMMGSIAGYCSARVYKLMHGKLWKRSTFLTATLFPGVVGVVVLLINAAAAYEGSTATIPFSTLLAVIALWLGVSTPLVLVGSYYGFRKETIEVPVRTNQINRHIPEQLWYTHPFFGIALGGILPFGAVCIELFFIMSAMWLHQVYYVFGFLFIVFVILIITCAEITIVLCYFQLCNEDYRWWWRSFLCSGSSAFYLLLYSAWYFSAKLKITGLIPSVMYFLYMFIAALTFFLLTGSIGFFSCLWFVRKIYAFIKVD
jgi:transmembrane 9 superfamily protein 2/4